MKRYWKNYRCQSNCTYEKGVRGEVQLALTDLEALQNRADFFCKIFKLANVNIARTSYNFDMSSFCDVIYNVVKHIAA